jgi:hypothetical protein
LQDHICNLHVRHFSLQYEVKIACNEGLWMTVNVNECKWM